MANFIEDINKLSSANPTLRAIVDQENAYVDQLIGEAGGDRDFAIRKLDALHKQALGNDDGARAQFFERVANKLEEKIGRIPYDYETLTSRETQDRDLALKRLDEDEAFFKTQYGREAVQSRLETGAELNSRGLVNGKYGEITGVGSYGQNATEGAISDRMATLERTIGRGREDTTTDATRKLEDITTTARREGQDAESGYSFGVEGANRAYDAKKKALERQRMQNIAQAPGSALYLDALRKGAV